VYGALSIHSHYLLFGLNYPACSANILVPCYVGSPMVYLALPYYSYMSCQREYFRVNFVWNETCFPILSTTFV
jgi:hypothetical protein